MNRKHWFLMLLCCLAAIATVGAVLLLGIPLNTGLLLLLVLICPLAHVLLMVFADREHETTLERKIPGSQTK